MLLINEVDVRDWLFRIINENFGRDLRSMKDDQGEMNLFGLHIHLSARDMVYMFYLIEKKFDIMLNEDDVDNDRFYTINGLIDIITSKLI